MKNKKAKSVFIPLVGINTASLMIVWGVQATTVWQAQVQSLTFVFSCSIKYKLLYIFGAIIIVVVSKTIHCILVKSM